MPVCPQCDNRQFTSKEALLQHMRSSSAWHPFCTQCDRRFVSDTAYEAHMAAKHPPTYDCTVCDRSFHASFALEDHYRGSNAHPNCTKCGKGFRDLSACDEHRRTEHPKSACGPCGGKIIYDDELELHYLDSPNHPKCTSCKEGFKDDAAYVEHMSTAHPEQHCATCIANFETPEALQAHFWASPAHPKCDVCNVGLANNEARERHLESVHTPTETVTPAAPAPALEDQILVDISDTGSTSAPVQPPLDNHVEPVATATAAAAPTPSIIPDSSFELAVLPSLPPPLQKTEPLASSTSSMYHTGFTPLSPRNPIQRLIIGEQHRINSPDLRIELGFSSPILDATPPFSPKALPRPGDKWNGNEVEKIWSLKENIQVAPAKANQFAPIASTSTWPQPGSTITHEQLLRSWGQKPGSPPRLSAKANEFAPTASTSRWPAGTMTNEELMRSFDQRIQKPTISPPRLPSSAFIPSASPPRMTSPPRLVSPPRERLSSPPRTEFHPRLYPGSVRAASLRQALEPLSEADLGVASIGNSNSSSVHRAPASVSGGTTYSYAPSRASQSPPQAYSFYASYPPSHYSGSVAGRSRGPPSDMVNWEELMGPAPSSPETIFSGSRSESRATLFSETLGTPKTQVASPTWSLASNASPSQGNLDAGAHQNRLILRPVNWGQQSLTANTNMSTSPSLATVSSPASGSSALGHSSSGSAQYEADTRPTTASSTPSQTTLGGLVYTITPSSECASPDPSPLRSPESDNNFNLSFTLNSPTGLRPLPTMSPLPSTPLDITEYDIPEARQPLPESPTEGMSPVTVVVELPHPKDETPDVLPVAQESREPAPIRVEGQVPPCSTSPLSTSSAQSFITSPQEPAEPEVEALDGDDPEEYGRRQALPSPLPSPRASPSPTMCLPADLSLDLDAGAAGETFLSDEMEMETSTPVDNVENQSFTLTSDVSSPVTPVVYGGAEPEEELKAEAKVDSSASPKPNPNPLHCRVCLADSCDDITASMCGHIFCNRCITDAVIKTSRCPVCMTPTLLYCLFRLDLAA